MRVRRLRAVGWRNLAPLDLTLDPAVRLNVFSGDNGQGKTNVIEALYYLAVFRSFRTTHAIDLVARGGLAAQLVADVESRELVRSVEVQLAVRARLESEASFEAASPQAGHAEGPRERKPPLPNRPVGRSIKLDSKAIRGLAAAFGALSVVLFVPEDLMLVRAAPAARRRFVDMAIAGVEPAFFSEAAAFQRILRSRNALLRSARAPSSSALLETYDEQLARAGARVVMRRRGLVQALAAQVDRVFRALHGDLPVGLGYVSDRAVMVADREPDVCAALLSGLIRRRSIDERRGHTTFGPQTDDLEIQLGDRPAREHASQGQLRSLVLAMKLAELAHTESCRGESPVLLLDDVPSELDPTRRRYLFETLAGLSCQTVVSVADPTVVPPTTARADFVVRQGRLTPVQVFPLHTAT